MLKACLRLAVFISVIFLQQNFTFANSCLNVTVIGSHDESDLLIFEDNIYTAGTFRVQNEPNESKQPSFNFSTVNCRPEENRNGKSALRCKVDRAYLIAVSEQPNVQSPNCTLDMESVEFEMKEISKGVFAGIQDSSEFNTTCYDTLLTINKNTQRVFQSFTRTKFADKIEETFPGVCKERPSHVLMNCTVWAGLRKNIKGRYCDFSSSKDKIQKR